MDAVVRPIITEKSMKEAEKGRYTFLVALHADKDGIKKAIEKMFKVHVVRTATVVVKGKSIRTGARRVELHKGPMKKAVVTVRAGEKISLFEQTK